MNSNTDITTMAIVDDVELLAILGLTSPPRSPTLCDTNVAVVLDWDDMPELSEDEEDTNSSISNNKRKYNQDVFAEFDFVEVSPIQQKKQKPNSLLIQQPFVSKEIENQLLEKTNSNLLLQDDEDEIKLALDLISLFN